MNHYFRYYVPCNDETSLKTDVSKTKEQLGKDQINTRLIISDVFGNFLVKGKGINTYSALFIKLFLLLLYL